MQTLIKFLLILFLLVSPAYATNWCADGNNKGCWLMEDTGNESDANTTTNNSVTETSGTIPRDTGDYKFGSSSRDIEIGDSEYFTHADSLDTDINGANQAISMMAYVKMEDDQGANMVILCKYDYGSNDRQYLLYVHGNGDNEVRCAISDDGSSYSEATGTTSLNAGTWYHVACVYDDTDIRIYIDGSLDSNGADNPKSYTAGIADKSAPFVIGAYLQNSSPSRYWDGLIDEVAIFDSALSAANVSDIKTNGLVQTGSNSQIIFNMTQ